jgi:predicted lipoprotein with Yx(FWY)xxD motif
MSVAMRLIAMCFAVLLASCSTPGPTRTADGVLTDSRGMTLYTFDKDAANSGRSVCNDKCAVLWPPLRAQASDTRTGDYTVVTRDDGTRQWAYKGKPLYLWVKDTKPGEKTGDGVAGAWRLARP